MPKPVCVPCERFMRPKKNGFYFIEGMPHSHPNEIWDQQVGKGSIGWSPYKLWAGDLWECPTCHQTVVLSNSKPVAEHYEPDFQRLVLATKGDQLLIKDC